MDVCTPNALYNNNNNNNKNTLHQNNKYDDLLQGKVSTLRELIDQLYNAFNTDVVDIDHVQAIMASYKSNPQEWKKYAKFDRYRYTRNLVDEGNGKFNLMILCWGEGHGSAIHDHANAHCVMKVLQGELLETKYDWPRSCRDSGDNKEPEELQETNKNTIGLNHVCYINDSIGLHRVENPSTVNPAVSLHLYSPPFSSCSVFNKQTGQRGIKKISEYGCCFESAISDFLSNSRKQKYSKHQRSKQIFLEWCHSNNVTKSVKL